jgi:hypothetical protein
MLRLLLSLLVAALLAATAARAADADGGAIVVIAHSSVAKLDAPTLQRLYTGRAIEVGGNPVSPSNLAVGNPLRERFLSQVLGQDNDKYVAYWTVRRHIGKGIPPREFRSAAEVIDHVQGTAGAIGYIAASDLRPGLNVVARP